MDIWSLPWLPPVIFSVVILLGVSLGYLNGWKTSTYFLGWNILGILVSIASFVFVYPHLLKIFPNKNIEDINIKYFLKINIDHAKPVFGLFYLLFVLLISNIFAFILYWAISPLRKFLRKELRINKKNGISSKGIRFVGAGVGTISAIPFAAFAASVTTLTNAKLNNFTRINSKLVKGLTFGQYNDPEQLLKDIRSYILITKDGDLEKTILGIFGTDHNNLPQELDNDQKHILETALNSKMIITTIGNNTLAKNLIGDADLSQVDFATTPKQLKASIRPYIKIENRDKLVDAIAKGVVPSTKNKNATKQQVKSYLTTLLDW